MKIQPEAVSAELMKILKDNEEYTVHSCFEKGFNIKVNEFLCFVGNRQNTKLPYGILLKEQHVFPLLELMDGRKLSFIWNKDKMQLSSEEITIELKECLCFSSLLKQRHNKPQDIYFDFLKDNIDMNLKTGLGLSLLQLINDKNERREKLYFSFQSKEEDSIRSALLEWIGYGLGLTPSGDDFLVGILFANKINPILGENFLQVLLGLVREQKYTTDISTHYYMSAFENCYNDALLDIYHGLLTADKGMLKRSIVKILQFGHTSGCDIMAGVLGGLNYRLKSHKLE